MRYARAPGMSWHWPTKKILNWTELNWIGLNWIELHDSLAKYEYNYIRTSRREYSVQCSSVQFSSAYSCSTKRLIRTELNWTELNWIELDGKIPWRIMNMHVFMFHQGIIQFGSVQFNFSILMFHQGITQFSSVQCNSVQFRSIQLSSVQFNYVHDPPRDYSTLNWTELNWLNWTELNWTD